MTQRERNTMVRTLICAALLVPLPAGAWFTSNAPGEGGHADGGGAGGAAGSGYTAGHYRWTLLPGRSLSEALKRAAAQDGWIFRWELPHDFPVEVEIPLAGSVDEMLRTLVMAYQARGEMAGVSHYTSPINKVASIGVMDMGVQK